MGSTDLPSTRPYLIRALYDWCTDNGFTPYVAVQVDHTVQVPREHVKNNEIVLNISFDATSALKLGNEFIEFRARFGGTAREILVPIGHVIAIYARENGQGMAFPGPPQVVSVGPAPLTAAPASSSVAVKSDERGHDGNVVPIGSGTTTTDTTADGDSEPPKPPTGPRPVLKRVK
jgi:stringent starvation protein B